MSNFAEPAGPAGRHEIDHRTAGQSPNSGRHSANQMGSKNMGMSQHGQRLRPILLASAVYALGVATPAMAQDQTAEEPVTGEASVASQAPNASGAEDDKRHVVNGSGIATQDDTHT